MNRELSRERSHLLTFQVAEYGIQYLDGGSAIQLIEYCPWCGKPLPESLRHQWFDAIEKLGLEPDDYNIPSEYISEEWYSRVAVREAELEPVI